MGSSGGGTNAYGLQAVLPKQGQGVRLARKKDKDPP